MAIAAPVLHRHHGRHADRPVHHWNPWLVLEFHFPVLRHAVFGLQITLNRSANFLPQQDQYRGTAFNLYRLDNHGDRFARNPVDRCVTLHPIIDGNVLPDDDKSTICKPQISDRN